MHDADLVISTMERLAGTGSRTAKAAILAEVSGHAAVQRAFLATYDWERTYGIRVTVDAREAEGPGAAGRVAQLFGGQVQRDPWTEFCQLLDDLAARRLTGNEARAAWTGLASRLSGRERVWFGRIVNRDLKVGVDRKTVATVWPDLIRPFGVQLAAELDPARDQLARGPTAREPWAEWPVLVEPKLDGMRVVVDYRADTRTAAAFSREGRALDGLQELVDDLAALLAARDAPSVRIDSEAFARDWNTTLSLVKGRDVTAADRAGLTFYCFDAVDPAQPAEPFIHRRARLIGLLDGISGPFRRLQGRLANNREELDRLYHDALDRGHEGVVVKFMDAPYQAKRNNAWLKIKPTATVDAVILDCVAGEPDSRHAGRLGALVVRRLDTGAECRVGGGFTDELRDQLWSQRAGLIGQVVEFREQAARGQVAAASFPRFVRLRPDREAS